jgi:hypothetical protein
VSATVLQICTIELSNFCFHILANLPIHYIMAFVIPVYFREKASPSLDQLLSLLEEIRKIQIVESKDESGELLPL